MIQLLLSDVAKESMVLEILRLERNVAAAWCQMFHVKICMLTRVKYSIF
jgi:hypothetical protein